LLNEYNNFQLQRTKQKDEEGNSSEGTSETKEVDKDETKEEDKDDQVITLRPLSMEDMRQAKNQVNSTEFPIALVVLDIFNLIQPSAICSLLPSIFLLVVPRIVFQKPTYNSLLTISI